MSPADIRRRFRDLGFEITAGRRHDFAVLGAKKIRLPNEHGSDVSADLISRMIRDAGISRDDWIG